MESATWFLLTIALVPVQPISEIRVEGNRNVPAEAILFYLQPLREKPLVQPLIEAAFKRLWDTGLFEDILFHRESTGTGEILLIVEVEEKRWLREVRTEGEHVFRTDSELREVLSGTGIDLRPRRPFGEEDGWRAARALEEILGQDYEVTGRLAPVETDRVDVVLSVVKSTPVRIGTIAFAGNQVLGDSRILEVMELRPYSWVNRLLGRPRFEPEILEKDLERIRDAYRRHTSYFSTRSSGATNGTLHHGPRGSKRSDQNECLTLTPHQRGGRKETWVARTIDQVTTTVVLRQWSDSRKPPTIRPHKKTAVGQSGL